MQPVNPDNIRTPALSIIVSAVILLSFGLMILALPACHHQVPMPGEPDPDPNDTMPSDSQAMPCDPATVYFTRDILPLLRSNCAKSGCHDAQTAKEDIILDSYANVIASRVINVNNPRASELIESIRETDSDEVMPPPPNQRLTTDQIALLEKWIQQGARNLTCDDTPAVCDTLQASYAQDVVPILQPNCIGCHSGGNPGGGIRLNTYAGVREVVLDGRLLGSITRASGFRAMPKNGDPLSACEISIIKAWINNGAPEN